MISAISIKDEIYRKIFHLSLLAIPISYHFIRKWQLLSVLIPVSAIVVLLDVYRRKNHKIQSFFVKIFGSILRQSEIENKQLCAASHALIALSLVFLLFKTEIAVMAALVLIISDSLAAVVGKSWPGEPFFDKTLHGSVAFFISALIVLIVCGLHYHLGFSLYIFGFFASFVATIIEARPKLININDNFAVPFSFALTMSVFDIIWNYHY